MLCTPHVEECNVVMSGVAGCSTSHKIILLPPRQPCYGVTPYHDESWVPSFNDKKRNEGRADHTARDAKSLQTWLACAGRRLENSKRRAKLPTPCETPLAIHSTENLSNREREFDASVHTRK
ncbi:hypothetical protein J3458_005139 [Metarhizium acridum]|uniref:uncharacterized protein n=1 Tax=Metarhizium acridum TaxID=92637 RepID=UPI001C6C93D1|nr:hypothetical protein J3458_005139 [Metarhizium acridum]